MSLLFLLALAAGDVHDQIDASMAPMKGQPATVLDAGIGAPDFEQFFDGKRFLVWERSGCRFRVLVDQDLRIERWEPRGRKLCRPIAVGLQSLKAP